MNKYKIEETLSNIQFQVYSDMNFIEPLGLDKETWKELLEYINKQKEVLDKIKERIKTYPHISYASVEEVDGKRLSGQLIPVTEILELLEELK